MPCRTRRRNLSALTVLLLDDLRDAWRHEPREHRLALVVILAVAVALRLLYLAQPMRNDEAVTYLDYVRLPFPGIVSTYTTANNHVFYTLLAKVAQLVFGNTEWVLRLPAFVAGVLTVPAAYAVARVLHDGRVGLVTAAFVATSGMLILYSTNGRGYSVVVLAFLLLLLVAIRILDGGSARLYALFALIGGLGLWTIPVMSYPLGAVALWMIFVARTAGKPQVARRTLLATAAAAGLAFMCYSPVLARHGRDVFFARLAESPSGWFEFFQTLPRSLANAVLSWSAGVPFLSVAVVLLALLSSRRPSRFPAGFGVAAFCWCSWLLLLTHRTPPSRVWLWLYPVIAMSAAVEIVAVLEARARTRALAGRLAIPVAAFAIAMAISVVTTRAVATSRETGSFRDARAAAEVLGPTLRPGDLLLAAVPSDGPLSYYLHRSGVRPPVTALEDASRVFVIVDVHERQSLGQLTHGTVLRDTTRFIAPRLVGTFTTSGIILIQRRHATSR